MANLPSNLTKTDIKWFITSLNDILKKEGQSEEDIKFLEYLKELTGQEDINEVLAALTDWFIAPDVEQPSQTTPENLEELVEASEKRKAQEAKSKATARAETRQFIKTQKQIYLNLPEKLNPPQITPEEETELNDLIQNKIKKNPTLYADTLAKEIVKQNTKPGMTKDQIKTLMANAKLVTINYTDKLLGLESKEEILGNAVKIAWAQNPIHVAASLANPDNPLIGEKTAGVAQITALTLENDYLIARNLLFDRANSRVLRLLYPGANEIILFGASNEANEKTVISVDREVFTNQGIKLEQTSDQIFELVKNKAWGPIKDKSWKVLDRTLSNTPWYSKIKSLVPDFLRPHIPVFAAGETVQPGLSLLWNSQGIKLLATDLPTLLSSSFGESVLLTPTFNFQFGSFAVSRTLFTTAEGLTGQALGINIGNFGVTLIRGGEKGLQILINLGAKAAAPVVTGAAAGGGTAAVAAGGLSGWLAGIMATLGAWGTPILMAIFAAVGWLAGKLLSGIVNWIRKHQDDLKIIGAIILGAGVLLRSLPLMVMGGLIFVPLAIGGGISMAGVGAGLFLFFRRLGKSMAITIGVPAIVTIIAFPILVAIILFIINSGAYIVPPGPATFGNIPPGGNLTKCDPNETGTEITEQLAISMESGSVHFLPDSLGSRMEGLCMTPTMVILHTSGGYDNDEGNSRTYETLVSRNVSCQLATDTDDTILMLSFFENQVENAWCANDLNAGGISIEMAGECQGGCAAIAKCSPNTSLTYTPNGPHPCPFLEDLSFNAICKIMQKYKIPWSQVFQHEASNGTHEDPIGDEWVDKFILRLKNNCQI